jgi:hypothetical protein
VAAGLAVDAASLALPAAAGTSIAQGAYLNAATAREPVAVLGAGAAAPAERAARARPVTPPMCRPVARTGTPKRFRPI